MRCWALVLLSFGLLAFPLAVEAQEKPPTGNILVGKVVDSDTGTPLLGAFVHLQGVDRGVITDDNGAFELPGLPQGTIAVAVEQLGYVHLVQAMEPEAGGKPVLFALTPDPILLEGIEVVMDRFETRRKAYAHTTQVLAREDLVTSSAFDLLDLIRSRSFLKPFPCPTIEIETTCAVVRGKLRPVSVYVDEMPFWGGLDFLTMVQPHELHMVEIFTSRGQVRVYTEGFMERVGARPVAVMPLGW